MTGGPPRGPAPGGDLLGLVPVHARSVLEVGCGAGALGAAFRQVNPLARLYGIEPRADRVERARLHLDTVLALPLDADLAPHRHLFPAEGIDCIVYDGVLDRIADPEGLLRQHLAVLAADGVVLIRVANGEHWRLTEQLLRGTLDDPGARDGARCRRSSRDAWRRLLGGAGLEAAAEISGETADDPDHAAFLAAMAPSLTRLGIDAAAFGQRTAPATQTWRAQRAARPTLNIMHTMLSPVGGVSHVRVIEPVAALTSEPSLRLATVNPLDLPEPGVDEPGIFIFHRPLLVGESGLARVRTLLAQGWLVVCEFDDHPGYIPVLQRPDVQNFRAVHAIQASTEPLAEVLREINPEVAVFPNAVARLPPPANHANPDTLTMIFAGLNRESEWPPYVDALNAVARAVGQRLRFQIVNDRGLFDALRTAHKSYTPLCDYETYRRLLASSEISFMPLADTPFNRCKSDLKFIEAASARVAALASPVVYGDVVEDGRTGLLFATPEELERQLTKLVESPALCRDIGDAARAHVMGSRMLAYQAPARAAWYHALWARREELNRTLLERVPELG